MGTYVRNPPTSSHTPGSQPGCVILVKLWQFQPDDRTQVVITPAQQQFEPIPDERGVAVMPLFQDDFETVRLEKWAANSCIDRAMPKGLELLVLQGDLVEAGETLATHSWLRLPPNSRLQAQAGPAGCTVWLKQGHLQQIRLPFDRTI